MRGAFEMILGFLVIGIAIALGLSGVRAASQSETAKAAYAHITRR